MSDAKVSALAEKAALASGDEAYVASGGASYRMDWANVFGKPLPIGDAVANTGRFTCVAVGGAPVAGTGFYAKDGLGTPGSQYGFYSDLPAGDFAAYFTGAAQSYFGGEVGIRSTLSTQASLAIGAPTATGTKQSGIVVTMLSPATATGTVIGYSSTIATTAAVYTLTNAYLYTADSVAIGAGSAATNVYGYHANANLATGTNNYAFYSGVTAGATNYAFYGAGTAYSYLGGELGLRNSPVTSVALYIGAPSGTDAVLNGVVVGAISPSTATTLWASFYSNVATPNTAYTLSNLVHFYAATVSKGAASTVTASYGFLASSAIAVGSTLNYAFYTDFNSATGAYAFYGAGTAVSHFGGPVGLLTTAPMATYAAQLAVIGTHQGTATTGQGIYQNMTVPSTNTSNFYGIRSAVHTAAAAFTLTNAACFFAKAFSKGAGSTITTGVGFWASSLLGGVATNTYGFFSDIANAATTWQLAMAGTAPSYFLGAVSIGTSGAGDALFRLSGASASGSATIYGMFAGLTSPSTNTSTWYTYYSAVTTATAAYTLVSLHHYSAVTSTLGAGSAVTSVYGFSALNAIAIGTNNYGFYSSINASTNAYALYAAGTAPSYMGGPLSFLNTSSAASLDVLLRLGGSAATHPSTSATTYGAYLDLACASTSTTHFGAYSAILRTPASAVTIGTVYGFRAQAWVLGAGSTVTTSAAFVAENATAIGATSYGYLSNLTSGTNKWSFYSASTAESFFGGPVGIFSANNPLTLGALLRMGNGSAVHPATGTSIDGISLIYSAPTTATSNQRGITVGLQTQASAYTVSNQVYFQAGVSSSKGAGSTINNSYGFYALNNMVQGTNNYGFYSDIANATTTYQMYLAGTAPSYTNGCFAISSTLSPTAIAFRVGPTGTMTAGSITLVDITGSAPTTVTTNANGYVSSLTLAASTAATNIHHFYVAGAALGAGASVTSVFGFRVDNVAAVGTNNYGFYSTLTAGAAKWAFYGGSTAKSYFGGPVGVGNASPDSAGAMFMVGGTHPSTATTVYAYLLDSTVPTTCTAGYYGFYSTIQTTAAAFAAGGVAHYRAANTTVGAGSSISTVYGFLANTAAISGKATNCYAFYSDVASASNTYQLYMVGTAASFIGQNLYIGSASTSTTSQLYVGGTHPGTTTSPISVNVTMIFPATATANAYGVQMAMSTAAAAFTMSSLRMFEATQVTLGAGSSITAVYGFMARNAMAVGGTNFGFYSDINTATNTWQFYAGGTALSYFAAAVHFGATAAAVSDATARIQLCGATSNMVAWNTNGSAAPAFTTRSAGTKLILYPNIGAATVDYAIGIEASNMWFSVQQQGAAVGWKFYGGTTLAWYVSSAGFHEGYEIADPSAPAANAGRLYFRDNGAGKTQLCVRFNTGAVQVVATEP
jgi:hypothetical protein